MMIAESIRHFLGRADNGNGQQTHVATREQFGTPQVPDRLREAVSVSVEQADAKVVRVDALNSYRGDMFLHSYLVALKREGWLAEVSYLTGPEIRKLKESRSADAQAGDETLQSLVINDLKTIFADAAKVAASDIHFDVTDRQDYLQVRFRVDGGLVAYQDYPMQKAASMLRALYGIMADETDYDYLRHEDQAGQIQGADFLPDEIGSMRLQRGPQAGGEFAVLRLFMREKRKVEDDLSPDDALEAFVSACRRYGYTRRQTLALSRAARTTNGATIFSGTTGSGKSTALKVILTHQAMMYPEKSFFSIEDPVEFRIKRARQLSVDQRKEETRSAAWLRKFRVAMRSDPDVIMVGELRDEATAQTAFQAVLSGHQLWTTTHAKDAFSVLTRLVNDFHLKAEHLINGNLLVALVNQSLLPALCPKCSIGWNSAGNLLDHDSRRIIQYWKDSGVPVGGIRVRNPEGCDECCRAGVKGAAGVKAIPGFKGRALVAEVVEMTNELTADLARDFYDTVRRYRTSANHFSKLTHALQRLLRGEIAPRSVISDVGNLPERIDDQMAIIEREDR